MLKYNQAGNYYHLLNIQTTAPVRPRQDRANYQSSVSSSLLSSPKHLTSPPVICHPDLQQMIETSFLLKYSSLLSPQKNIIYNYFPIRNSHQWQLLVFCPQCLLRHETLRHKNCFIISAKNIFSKLSSFLAETNNHFDGFDQFSN